MSAAALIGRVACLDFRTHLTMTTTAIKERSSAQDEDPFGYSILKVSRFMMNG
jgi:hypothetical protein